MKIWRISPNNETIQIVPTEDWGLDYAKSFDGTSKIEQWEKIEVKSEEEYCNGKISDVLDFAPDPELVLTEFAVQQLCNIIKKDVELLPVDFNGTELWLMYVTTVLDCVDYSRSQPIYLSTGKLSYFEELFFKRDVIRGHALFKIQEKPNSYTYCTDVFKNAVEQRFQNGPDFDFICEIQIESVFLDLTC